jgi:hypothetical protein
MTFKAWRADRYVSLWDILTALGGSVQQLLWRIRIDEAAPGPDSDQLATLSPDAWVDTPWLLRATAHDVQLIDGQVLGYRGRGSDVPCITIRAVDSTWWDVESEDHAIIEVIMTQFPDVEWTPH